MSEVLADKSSVRHFAEVESGSTALGFGVAPSLRRRTAASLLALGLLVLPAIAQQRSVQTGGPQGGPVIAKGQVLSLDKCIAIALERQPQILAARGTAEADRALVREAESAYYPQINWLTSVSRTARGAATNFGITTAPRTFNFYSTGLSLSQNVFDFGRTAAQVSVDRFNYRAALTDVENTTETIVLNVKTAYFGVLAAVQSRDVAAEAVKQYQLHLDQAQGFYDVGTAPKYDVTKAQVDLGNARINLIKAENGIKQALAALNNAMGITGTLDYTVEDVTGPTEETISFDDALARAYANRPDLKSAVARRQAGESSVSLAKRAYFPSLGGSAGWNYTGNEFPLSRGWNIGLSLNVPVFNGFLTAAQVSQAKSQLTVLRADEDAARLTVFLDVETAYLNLQSAQDLIPVAKLNVTAAQENLDIANGEYKEGLGNPIQVADAEANLSNAKLAYIQALYDFQIARASLEKAMGSR